MVSRRKETSVKKCIKCKDLKSETEFYKKSNRCKACCKKSYAQYYRLHAKRLIAERLQKYHTDPIYKLREKLEHTNEAIGARIRRIYRWLPRFETGSPAVQKLADKKLKQCRNDLVRLRLLVRNLEEKINRSKLGKQNKNYGRKVLPTIQRRTCEVDST